MRAIVRTECFASPFLIEVDRFLSHDTENLIGSVESWALSLNPQYSLKIARDISTAQTWLYYLAKRIHQSGEEHSYEILTTIKHQRERLERLQRGFALLNARSSEGLEIRLYWYVERGDDRDLRFLDRIQNEPVCGDEKARRLLEKAYKQIRARVLGYQPFPAEPPPGPVPSPQDPFKPWSNEGERILRRQDLQAPYSLDAFINAIRWMAERGDLEDLDLLRQVRADPPYNSELIQKLLETAEERIHDRVYDPQTVVDREEAAYQEHRQEWDEKYAGEFIAIHRGQVIDHDTDEDRLIERLDERQRNEGRFRAYIVEIGAPVYVARGPTVLRSQKVEMTAERS